MTSQITPQPATERAPQPATERAPLSAASALELAVAAVPPAPAPPPAAPVALRDPTPPPWARPLTLEGIVERFDQLWRIAIGADNRTLQTAADVAAMRASQSRVETGMNELKRAHGELGELLANGFAGIQKAFKNREEADRAQDDKIAKVEGADTEITKRISVTNERVDVVEKKTNAFEAWMTRNPRLTWWTCAGTAATAGVGLLEHYGPAMLQACAHAWATAHGITVPTP